MFKFEWIWLFLALPLPILIQKYFKPAVKNDDQALKVPFYQQLTKIANDISISNTSKLSKNLILAWLVWLLLITAAARPVFLIANKHLPSTGRDLMFAVDISDSMQIADMDSNKQKVDRLTVTKNVLKKFIKNRVGDRLGLILFGTYPYLQAPLTFDRQTVETLLLEAHTGMAGTQTSIGDAIGLAIKHLRNRPENSRVLVLLTDGANTAGEMSPIQAAKIAKQENIKIYTIGIGADELVIPGIFGSSLGSHTVNPSADLDEKTLTEMANMTGGKYYRAKNLHDLTDVYKTLDTLEPALQEDESFRINEPLFYYPLVIALLISLFITISQLGILNNISWGRKKSWSK
jgi:Ca-activated chloride channel family protein